MYVVMQEGKARCLRVEVPMDTLIVGEFESFPLIGEPLGSSNPYAQVDPSSLQTLFYQRPFGIEVTIKGSQEEIISQKVYPPSSRFALSAPVGGEYGICFVTNTTAWYNPLRFKMEIILQTGAEAVDYDDVASKEHLDALQLEARKLNDRAHGIRNEMAYQKQREEDFRSTSESTNTRAMWWSVYQIVIVLASVYFQLKHLKGFFRKKKLI
uniref:GOLD domain-containing protein n=1 Tax=Arcella intermedia TaxID=1963864 RepID=A0A6B2LHZ1_9EUKA